MVYTVYPTSVCVVLSVAAGVGETRVVFGQWLPNEGTPKRVEALHVLVAPKSSPASSAVQKSSLPRQPSTPGVTAKQRLELEEEGSKPVGSGGMEAGVQSSVAEGVQEGKGEVRQSVEGERDEEVYIDEGEKEEGRREGKRKDEVNVGGDKEGRNEGGEKGGEREEGDKPADVEVVREVDEGAHEAEPQGERLPVSESVKQEGGGSEGRRDGSRLNVGERDGESNVAEVMPRVESSGSWVVVSAGASECHVKPHPHVRSAWEEDAQLPQTDHKTATPETTSQCADTGHKQGVMSVEDIELAVSEPTPADNKAAATPAKNEVCVRDEEEEQEAVPGKREGCVRGEEEEEFSTPVGHPMPQVRSVLVTQ